MANFSETTDESKQRWETNADFWDEKMGDQSNFFHRNIVRPHTEQLLDIKQGDLVLDIACGNGNFSQRLAEKGADVIAFDYSEKMILHARKRRSEYLNKISFHVCDATDHEQLLALKQSKPFDKAVANMAVMDISNIEPLLHTVHEMLMTNGIFVFSTHHPCFVRPDEKYLSPCVHEGEAIRGQPIPQFYYHRPLQTLFQACFKMGFMIDGFFEVPIDESEQPIILIIRLRKVN
jgi:2-polyprenyl-3-methyl-5-hydroxy-6-metoxy-1,4-benzoquinol methylase